MASMMPKNDTNLKLRNKTSLAKSYLFGMKKGLPRKIKKAHKKLHLLHLMTPSGLHLGIGMIIFKKYIKKQIIIKLFLVLMTFLSIILGDFFALRRMAIFGITNNFILTFVIDFFLGGWSASPFSYALSFLFLGLILINKDRANKYLAKDFFIAQILIATFFEQKVYPIGFIIGFFFTPLISAIFPLFIIDLFNNNFTPVSDFISFILLKLSSLIELGLPPLYAFLFISFFYLPYLSLFITITFPENIHNLPKHYIGKKAFPTRAPQFYQDIVRTSSGYKLSYPKGLICRARLYSSGWSTRCKF